MIAALVGIFTSSGFGALIGLLGGWLTRKEETKNLKAKYDYEVKMADLRRQEMEVEAKMQIKVVETEGAIQQDIVDGEAFLESLKEQKRGYGIKVVDAVKGLMRPFITLYVLAIATFIIINIGRIVGGLNAFDFDQLINIYKSVIAEILFICTTAITWWFGSRPSRK
jgi:hypothetical protein